MNPLIRKKTVRFSDEDCVNALPYLIAGFSGTTNVENNSHAASGTLEDLSSTAVRSSSNIVKKLGEISPAVANTCIL